MAMKQHFLFALLPLLLTEIPGRVISQAVTYTPVNLVIDESYQTMAGFGASLAYYENWLTAHPWKGEIYDAIFKELSLDILRVRNAFGYDNTMITRVKEFHQAALKSLGRPIVVMVTSWSPPGYLKSNNSHTNGGTLKYSVSNGKVNFGYAEFARWWNQSLYNYNANGIYPAYISIQNEPEWKTSYESCLLKPSETVTATDTIAGYNKALDAVYDTLRKRNVPPRILGPECVGIGYNSVENYVNALDVSKLYGIAHHLYHGANETDPYSSTDFAKVGNYRPGIPHFQTEYSRGDWFPMAGMIYKSLNDENAVAYLFWDLIWTGGGLVDLEFPWDANRWTTPKGYTRTKHFFIFKQFSAWIHPGWKRVKVNSPSPMVKSVAFISAGRDSATLVAINTSGTTSYGLKAGVPGYTIDKTMITRTSAGEDGVTVAMPADSVILVPRSVSTLALKISEANTGVRTQTENGNRAGNCAVYPNPVREEACFRFTAAVEGYYNVTLYDLWGRKITTLSLGFLYPGEHNTLFRRNNLQPGIYLFTLETKGIEAGRVKFCVGD